jgi:hypothetical protein
VKDEERGQPLLALCFFPCCLSRTARSVAFGASAGNRLPPDGRRHRSDKFFDAPVTAEINIVGRRGTEFLQLPTVARSTVSIFERAEVGLMEGLVESLF